MLTLEDIRAEFAQQEKVKTYVRKDGSIVKSYQRKGELAKQQNQQQQNQQQQTDENKKGNGLKTAATVLGAGLLVPAALVGGTIVSKKVFQAKMQSNTSAAANKIIRSTPADIKDIKIPVMTAKGLQDMPASQIANTDKVFYTVGGFAARQGRHSDMLAESILKKYPDAVVIPVRNSKFDVTFRDQSLELSTIEAATAIPQTVELLLQNA